MEVKSDQQIFSAKVEGTKDSIETKGKILPSTLGVMSIFFVCQILAGGIALLLAAPMGIQFDPGYTLFYGVGFGLYYFSFLLLLISLIFISITAFRLGKKLLRDNENKSRSIIVRSLLILIVLVILVLMSVLFYEDDFTIIWFGLVNIFMSFILGTIFFDLEGMLANITGQHFPKSKLRFISRKPLVIVSIIWAIVFTIFTSLIYCYIHDYYLTRNLMEYMHFAGILAYSSIGILVIVRMRTKWIKDYSLLVQLNTN